MICLPKQHTGSPVKTGFNVGKIATRAISNGYIPKNCVDSEYHHQNALSVGEDPQKCVSMATSLWKITF